MKQTAGMKKRKGLGFAAKQSIPTEWILSWKKHVSDRCDVSPILIQ